MNAWPPAALPSRVRGALTAELAPGTRLLVGFSGGRDSSVLLHLLRLGEGGGALAGFENVLALHVDHAMRPESQADASWARGVCRAWGVPFRLERLDPPPRGETEARRARYEVLARVAREEGCGGVVLAHHADDQAETVLFRLLRGTGPRGLAGIPRARPLDRDAGAPLLVRPLLEISGGTLEAWAARHGVPRREDPSNRGLAAARNRIRLGLLPALEAEDPEVRASLRALAGASRAREEVLGRIVEAVLGRVEGGAPGSLRLDRLVRLPAPLLAELLRQAARRGGGRLPRRGTEALIRFVREGRSGQALDPAPGIRVIRDFDLLHLEVRDGVGIDGAGRTPPPPLSLIFPREGGGGRVAPGGASGRWWEVRGGPGTLPEAGVRRGREGGADHVEVFPAGALRFPLRLRGRRPGDRVRVTLEEGAFPGDPEKTGPGSPPSGSAFATDLPAPHPPEPQGGWGAGPHPGPHPGPRRRRLKKLLAEQRVSRKDRDDLPLLVDAEDLVIWVPGVWRSRGPRGDGRRGEDGTVADPWSIRLSETPHLRVPVESQRSMVHGIDA